MLTNTPNNPMNRDRTGKSGRDLDTSTPARPTWSAEDRSGLAEFCVRFARLLDAGLSPYAAIPGPGPTSPRNPGRGADLRVKGVPLTPERRLPGDDV